jgi:hypothetical protein
MPPKTSKFSGKDEEEGRGELLSDDMASAAAAGLFLAANPNLTPSGI